MSAQTEKLTPKDKERLLLALASALTAAPKARSAEMGLFFQCIMLRDSPQEALQELQDLLGVMKSIPNLKIFEHAEQVAFGTGQPIDMLFLSNWLVSRGQQVGEECAIDNLNQYLVVETLELYEILAVDGFYVSRTIDFGGFRLDDWQNITMSDRKWWVQSRVLFGAHSPSAAVVRTHKVPKLHLFPWDNQTYGFSSIDPALDILRCVTAIAGVGVRLLHHWFEPPEWAPWKAAVSHFGVDSTVIPMHREIDEDCLLKIQECVNKFEAMDEKSRQRLRVPLDRLQLSILKRIRSVDAAIELGVALESLYAPNKLSEGISYTIRTRAARFLESSLEGRKRISATIKDIYDLRSRAIHSGRFDGEGSSRKWQDIVGKSLVKVIQEGEPTWEDFDLMSMK
jgi:Apea-like HEPN